MPTLAELQRAFTRRVLTGGDEAILAHVAGRGLAPAERLDIYCNNFINTLTETLRISYPAVDRLVGEAFFDAVAMRYVRGHPPVCGNLQRYGDAFPGFLAELPEAAGLPYLAAVAHLEWARQQAMLAADAEPLTMSALAQTAPDDYPALQLALHPSVQLLSSPHPVLDIWLYCQRPAPETELQLRADGDRVLVLRADDEVAMLRLDAGEEVFLRACAGGRALGEAAQTAWAEAPDFDLEACLGRHLAAATFAQPSSAASAA
jgi:hypothetical protein